MNEPKNVDDAAYAFRQTMVPRADLLTAGKFPMWYGWAIFDAFKAGAQWAAMELQSPATGTPSKEQA